MAFLFCANFVPGSHSGPSGLTQYRIYTVDLILSLSKDEVVAPGIRSLDLVMAPLIEATKRDAI